MIGRYFYNLLNTISHADAENNEIKEFINQRFTASTKQLFLNKHIAVADDVSDPDYLNSSNAPDLPAFQYLNAFNTFYGKSDSSFVYIKEIRSSQFKKGKKNIFINVYFTSFFQNECLSHPSTPYKPANRVAEIFIKGSNSNKWLLYISRIAFFTPAYTLNDYLDNIVITEAKTPIESSGIMDETLYSADKFNLYIIRARLEENKRNFPAAVNLYFRAIELAPEKKGIYETRIQVLNTHSSIIADMEGKYKAGDFMGAVKAYTKLLRNPPINTGYSNSDYYLGRAKCFDKMGQLTRSYNEQVEYYNDALKDYAKIYEYDKDNMETIRCRVDLYRRMNRNVGALETQ